VSNVTDDDARKAGFRNAREMQDMADALEEDYLSEQWASGGAPSPLEMWRELHGAREAAEPLTVKQAAEREKVDPKTIRRKLAALAAMDPPGAWRIGDGDRAHWRIVPAALDALRGQSVAPDPARPQRPSSRPAPAPKRSPTRWEI
jgi:hypothetical protein